MRLIAASVFFLLLLCAAVIVVRSSYNFAQQDREHISAGRDAVHSTGTDDLGRDRTLRTASALLLCLAGAALASAMASTFAVSLGVFAAFAKPWVGRTLLYVSDLALTLPWLFLLLIVRAAMPLNLSPARGAALTFLMLGLLGWPAFTRANHARAAGLRRADWLMQNHAMGLRSSQLFRHLLPHVRPLLLTQFLVYVPVCVVAEANLGALGMGVSEPLPSWGSLLLALQSSAVLASTRWVYLPVALLVVVLLSLETMTSEKNV